MTYLIIDVNKITRNPRSSTKNFREPSRVMRVFISRYFELQSSCSSECTGGQLFLQLLSDWSVLHLVGARIHGGYHTTPHRSGASRGDIVLTCLRWMVVADCMPSDDIVHHRGHSQRCHSRGYCNSPSLAFFPCKRSILHQSKD